MDHPEPAADKLSRKQSSSLRARYREVPLTVPDDAAGPATLVVLLCRHCRQGRVWLRAQAGHTYERLWRRQPLARLCRVWRIKPEVAHKNPAEELCLLLGARSSWENARVEQMLVRLGEPAVEPLSRVLAGGTMAARSAAIKVLGQMEHPSAIPPLCKAIEDRFYMVREQAAEALAKIGAPAIEPLQQVLETGDEDARAAALSALSKMKSQDVMALFLKALHSPDINISWLAEDALVNIGRPAIDALCSALENEKICNRAQRALVRIGPPAVDKLCRVLTRGYFRARERAATVLGHIGDPRAVYPLCQALRDSLDSVSAEAAMALGQIGDPRAVEPLYHMLRDTRIGPYAREALVKIGPPAVEQLCYGLRQGARNTRQMAASALGQMGDLRAVEPLCSLLQDADIDGQVLRQAATALANLNDLRAVEPLCGLLTHTSAPVRLAAVLALGKIGDMTAVKPLCRILEDTDPDLRQKTAQALGVIGRREALPSLRVRLHPVTGEHNPRILMAIRAAIKNIEHSTAPIQGLPRATSIETLEASGRPRAAEATLSPDGRPRAGASATLNEAPDSEPEREVAGK